MFGGVSLKEHQSDLQRKKRSESMRTIQKAEDKRLLANALLRAERLKRLVQIEDQDGLHHNLVSLHAGSPTHTVFIMMCRFLSWHYQYYIEIRERQREH